jgi:hypothetical protein
MRLSATPCTPRISGRRAPTEAEKIRRARRWFASQLTEFRQVVCTHRIVERYLEKKDSAERELFDAVVTYGEFQLSVQ